MRCRTGGPVGASQYVVNQVISGVHNRFEMKRLFRTKLFLQSRSYLENVIFCRLFKKGYYFQTGNFTAIHFKDCFQVFIDNVVPSNQFTYEIWIKRDLSNKQAQHCFSAAKPKIAEISSAL